MSNICPYCGGVNFSSTTTNRPRPDTFTMLQCNSCNDYVARHASGNVYPLEDRTDPETDFLLRVVD